VLVKAKALHRDAFFQIIAGRVINTHFILSQQKGDRMSSDLEEEEAIPSLAYHAVTTSTTSTTFSIETICFFWAVISSDVSQKSPASIFRVNEL
jgi:hypothetical protein